MDVGMIATWAVGFVGVLAALGVFGVLFRVAGADTGPRVVAKGVQAEARVTGVERTGRFDQQLGEIRIALQVEPSVAPPFAASVMRMVGSTERARLRPGAVVEVRFEAQNPQNLLISRIP